MRSIGLRHPGHNKVDDILHRAFSNALSIRISLKSVPNCPMNNKLSLVQIMAWQQAGNRPLSEIILCLRPANERRRYNVTSPLIGWAHTQNDPCIILTSDGVATDGYLHHSASMSFIIKINSWLHKPYPFQYGMLQGHLLIPIPVNGCHCVEASLLQIWHDMMM